MIKNFLIKIFILTHLITFVYGVNINDAFGKNCTVEEERKICGSQLVCLNNICSNCVDDSHCSTRSNIICKDVDNILIKSDITNSNITHVCEHKDIFSNVNGWDVGAIILTFLIAMFAAITGIGGGGFFVVIFILMLEFDVAMAARISTAMIFGISISNIFNYLPQRHLSQNKPLIDYDVMVIMTIYTLAGTVFGVILNIILPTWLISILLVGILIFVGVKTTARYIVLRNEEKDDEEQEEVELSDLESDNQEENQNMIVNSPEENFRNYHVLPNNILQILGWIIVLTFSILKGGKETESLVGVEQCSAVYWVLNVIQVITICLLGLGVGIYLYKKYLKRKEIDDFQKGDVKWNKKNSFILPPIVVLAGLISSTFGLGGGIIKTPIMIELKMLPDVIVATSAYSLVFSSSSSLVQYFLFGVLPYDYAIVFIGVGFISGLIGHSVIGFLINKKGETNLLLLILGILTFVIAGVAFSYAIYNLVADIKDGVSLGFNDLC
jgi:uncharacterized membrane protein YfcA